MVPLMDRDCGSSVVVPCSKLNWKVDGATVAPLVPVPPPLLEIVNVVGIWSSLEPLTVAVTDPP